MTLAYIVRCNFNREDLEQSGLDKHTPSIGYAVVDADVTNRPLDVAGAVEGLYHPITELVRADQATGIGRP